MSQPDTELATELGEDTLDSIAESMGSDDEPEHEDLPEEEEPEEEEAEGDEEQETEDDPEAGGDEDDPEVEWTTNTGKTYRVKQSELRDGYMRQDDYQRKTATLAEQRRAVEAAQQQIEQERTQAANQLDVLIDGLYKQLVGDQQQLAKLIEEDPQEYLRQQAAMQQRSAQLQQAMAQRQALQGRQSEAEQAKQREWRQAEREKLLDKLPHWADEKKAAPEQQEIAEYLSEIGYSADELNELVDHRALLVARDAAKYRQMQRAKEKRSREVTRKPIRPGAAGGPNPNTKAQRAAEALRRNPDSLDALAGLVGSQDQ